MLAGRELQGPALCLRLWARVLPLNPPLLSTPNRLCVLLLVCAAQAWLMWRFIHSQLRHWREYWNEQNAKRRVPAASRLPARLLKRESGECQGPSSCEVGVEELLGSLCSLQTSPACSSFLTASLRPGIPP